MCERHWAQLKQKRKAPQCVHALLLMHAGAQSPHIATAPHPPMMAWVVRVVWHKGEMSGSQWATFVSWVGDMGELCSNT